MAGNKCKVIFKFALVFSLLVGSGCSSRNVMGDFDCPAENGKKCEKIKTSDERAWGKLESKNSILKEEVKGKREVEREKEYTVKFAPFFDESGNYHKKSEVVYHAK